MRALVIDPDPDVRDLEALLLRRAGFDVEAVADHRGVLASAVQGPFDVIVLDVRPGQDAGESIRTLRLREGRPTPVVVVSALARVRDEERALAAGAAAYVVKPYSRQRLLEAVQGVVVRPADTPALVRAA